MGEQLVTLQPAPPPPAWCGMQPAPPRPVVSAGSNNTPSRQPSVQAQPHLQSDDVVDDHGDQDDSIGQMPPLTSSEPLSQQQQVDDLLPIEDEQPLEHLLQSQTPPMSSSAQPNKSHQITENHNNSEQKPTKTITRRRITIRRLRPANATTTIRPASIQVTPLVFPASANGSLSLDADQQVANSTQKEQESPVDRLVSNNLTIVDGLAAPDQGASSDNNHEERATEVGKRAASPAKVATS